MADGEIRLDIRAKTDKLSGDIAKSTKELDRLGNSFDKQVVSIRKQEAALTDLKRQLDAIASGEKQVASVTALESQLKRVGAETRAIEKENESIIAQYNKAVEYADNVKGLGFDPTSISDAAVEVDRLAERMRPVWDSLDASEKTAADLGERLAQLKLNPEATSEAQNLAEKISIAEEKLRNTRDTANTTNQQIVALLGNKDTSSADSVKRIADEAGAAGQKVSTAGTSVKRLGNETQTAGKKAKTAANSFEKLGRKIKTIVVSAFVFNVLRTALRKLRDTLGSVLLANNEFSQSWNAVKVNMLAAFAPIWEVIQPALISLMNLLAKATAILAQFVALLFGKTVSQAKDSAKAFDDQAKALDGVGASAKKAAGQLAHFDDVNVRTETDTGGGGSGGAGGLEFESIEPDISWLDKFKLGIEDLLKRFPLLQEAMDAIKIMGENIWAGIKRGLEKVDFTAIGNNLRIIFEGLAEIATAAFRGALRIGIAMSELTGTLLEWGIAISGKLVEILTQGFAQFITNSKDKIIQWIEDTTISIENTFKNLTSIAATLGEIIYDSLEEKRDEIADTIENMLSAFTDVKMLQITIMVEGIERVTEEIEKFVTENEGKIKEFVGNIIDDFNNMATTVSDIVRDLVAIILEWWETGGADIVNIVSSWVMDIVGWVLDLYNVYLSPIFSRMLDWLKKIWDEALSGIVKKVLEFVNKIAEFLNMLWEDIRPFVDFFMEYMLPMITEAIEGIVDMFGYFVLSIGNAIDGIMGFLNGLMEFIMGVFSGDWERAWGGIVDAFTSLFSGLEASAKNIINGLIGFINGMIRAVIQGINAAIDALNKIKLPDWLPGGLGGKSINIPRATAPQIPYFAKGGIVTQATIAMIGERGREAVLPLDRNTGWIQELAGQLSGGMGNSEVLDLLNELIQAVKEKNMTLSLDGREVMESVDRARASRGLSMVGG